MKALVLSGGGSKGAYQAGALCHLLGERQTSYDALCGVSVGSLNAAFLAQYQAGEEQVASIELSRLWESLDDSKVYKSWCFFGRLAALWKTSLYNSEPLQKLVRSSLDMKRVRASKKLLRVGAVGLSSGRFKLFDEQYVDVPSAVLASAAFPGMLCPIELEGELWTDGGVREITPLKAAIDLGATEIDVVVCSPENPPMRIPGSPSTLTVAERSIDLMGDEILSNDLKVALMYNKMVAAGYEAEKRHIDIRVIRPRSILIENSLDFTPRKLRDMYARGYLDAVEATT